MFTFGQASQFSRLVHEARLRYRRWCPTCGLSESRWAGCIDPFHGLTERVYGDSLWLDIDDPGTACDGPGSDEETTLGGFPA